MHFFLTGDMNIGKTTLIRRFLSLTDVSADGFLTYWEPDSGCGRSLYLSPYSRDLCTVDRYRLARYNGNRFLSENDMIGIFDIRATEILDQSGKRDVIIMDELGVLESGAHVFQRAVLGRLSGDVPVLGVIKPKNTEFLDAVRAHPDVSVFTVTENNREEALRSILSNFGAKMTI